MPGRLVSSTGTWFCSLLLACRPTTTTAGDGGGPSSELRGWSYVAELAPEARGIAVTLCFDGRPPAALTPIVPEALAHIGAPRVVGSARELRASRGQVALDELDEDACVAWQVDFDAMLAGDHERSLQRLGDSLMVRQSAWLLWPADPPAGIEPALELRLPERMRASVPWPTLGAGDRDGPHTSYVLDDTVPRWLGYNAFGELDIDRFAHAGAEIEIVRLDQAIACDRACVRRWIVDAVDSSALLYGSYPRDRLQVIVVPVERGDGAVYFGAAARGGGAGVYLLLDTAAKIDRLLGGWTTVHELLHHGMPFVEDAWMAEGWVSYYTEVMRTRMGHRSEAEGWHELADAFARGRAGVRDQSLQELSDEMHETHAYQRVYWGGGAIAFDIDVTMRLASGGERGLDDAVRHLRSCCGDTSRRRSASKLLAELDRWYGEPIFTAIARRHLLSAQFPDVAAIYARLGISLDAGGVKLDDAHPAAAVRRGIMASRATREGGP